MWWWSSSYSLTAVGKSDKDIFVRLIAVTNLTSAKQKNLVLALRGSLLFEDEAIDIELEPNKTLIVPLPHVPRAGSEMKGEEAVTYVLLQGRKEQCTISATVRMRDHSRFFIRALQGNPVDPSRPFMREFVIQNNSSIPLPATATLEISGSACFQPCSVVIGEMAVGDSKLVQIPHRPLREDISLATVEEHTSYTLRNQGVVLATIDRRARMYEYSGYLMQFRPSDGSPIRILLCGNVGMGKTSFVRAVCSALDPGDQVLCNVVPVSAFAGSGTETYHKYSCGPDLPFVHLFDPWGHQPANYMHNEYLMMLDGVMQPGSHRNHPVEEEKENYRIHSVVLFVPASNQGLERETGIVMQALARDQNPTIAMSLCESQLRTQDEIVAFRKNPNQLPDNLEDKRRNLSVLGPGAVLQVAPYVGDETTKSFERDRLSLRLLEQALRAGLAFQRFH